MISNERKTILINGGNRGIGLAIVKALAQHAELHTSTTTIFVGCRNIKDGQTAVDDLVGVTQARITPLQLDVTSNVSIVAAGSVLRTYQLLNSTS